MIIQQDIEDTLTAKNLEIFRKTSKPIYFEYSVYEDKHYFEYAIACVYMNRERQITGNISTIPKHETLQSLIDQVSKGFESCLTELGITA